MYYCQFCGKPFKRKSSCTQHEKYYCISNPDRLFIKKATAYRDHKKVACKICGHLFDVANIKKHENSCGKIDQQYHITHEGLNCVFCGKLCKNKNSLAQHEIRCRENPNRKDFNNLADYVIREAVDTKTVRYQKCQDTLRKRIAEGEISYDNNVRCKYKFGTYKGYHCDSSWELAFVIYNLDHGINFIRNTDNFPYFYKGTLHQYYPDFIIDNTYYEIKSYIDERVICKNRDFPKDKTLVILDQEKIQPYLNYCETTYGKDFINLYDRSSPSWLDY